MAQVVAGALLIALAMVLVTGASLVLVIAAAFVGTGVAIGWWIAQKQREKDREYVINLIYAIKDDRPREEIILPPRREKVVDWSSGRWAG
jgi:hypothetical protein